MGKVIGIDLGTTNSCVALLEGGKPVIVANSEGGRTTPSVVSFGKGGERLVGQLAKRQSVTNPENTVFSIKRFIGRRWEETLEERSRVPYQCRQGRDKTVEIDICERQFTPQEISAAILQKLKADAEVFLGEPITDAVITVPAYFTDAQRQATKDAGIIAGLDVKRIINEPTAAALAYGLDKQTQEQYILVFDLGGGTFDVSLLQLGKGVFEVRATAGNNHLGGDDFDSAIIDWLKETFEKEVNIKLGEDKMAIQRLREAAEKAKIELSSLQVTSINLPFIAADENGPHHLEIELTRGKFEELTKALVHETLNPVNQALRDSELTPDNINRVLLVGGSTRIPAVQRIIKRLFPNSQIERSINPDEAVALGAAIQGGVLGGEIQEVLLLDVTPLSLGIETLGEVFTKVIERNTTIPTSRTQVFSTAVDGQTSVEIQVLQGERVMAKDNMSLGKFLLTGIPPSHRGVPQIEVSFEIDVNGILRVGAQDLGTGREQSIVITSTGGLSGEEIERLRQEALQYADQDRYERERVDFKNQADNLLYSYETALRENGDIISESLKLRSQQKQEQLTKALQDPKTGLSELNNLLEELRQVILEIGTEVYQEANQRGADANESSSEAREPQTMYELQSYGESISLNEVNCLAELSDFSESNELSQSQDFTDSELTFSNEGSIISDEIELDFDFDEDDTIATDYEPID